MHAEGTRGQHPGPLTVLGRQTGAEPASSIVIVYIILAAMITLHGLTCCALMGQTTKMIVVLYLCDPSRFVTKTAAGDTCLVLTKACCSPAPLYLPSRINVFLVRSVFANMIASVLVCRWTFGCVQMLLCFVSPCLFACACICCVRIFV